MAIQAKLEEILISTRSLPTEDKCRLIRYVTDQIEGDFKKSRLYLAGLCVESGKGSISRQMRSPRPES